ncbi:MAG: sulfotransferase [Rickettsiales bacterium]|nr:sulfotransferase [Rickettsiales bacterium]
MQIIVLGVHRSGTSLVTRLINMMGAFFDTGHASIGFNDENPKGFWERSDVIACNDQMLALQQSSWDQLAQWKQSPPKTRKPSPEQEKIEHAMKTILLTLDANRPWVVKDPRMCLTFDHWRAHLEVPVVICVHRDPLEVALSLSTRNGFSFAHGLAIWEYYAVSMLNSMRGLPVIFIEHKAILNDPVAVVKSLYEQLNKENVQGLRLPSDKEITTFIEPSLYRSKLTNEDYEQGLTSYHTQLIEMLTGKRALPEKNLMPSLAARDAMKAFEKLRRMEIQMTTNNNHYAAAQQELNELKDFRQRILTEVQHELLRSRKILEEKDEQIKRLKSSRSWKLGNGFIRLITLRWFTRPPMTMS